MIIGPTQTFIFALLAGGAYGAHRGWSKEVITTAVVLSTVLFLANGGAEFLARLFAGTLGAAGGTATGGPLFAGGGGGTAPPYTGTTNFGTTAGVACSTALVTAVSRITFVVLTWVGYRSGTRFGSTPKLSSHRIAGIVPGVINGAAIAYYVSNYVLPGTSVVLNTPGGLTTSSALPIVFGIGIAALLIVLFVAGQMKKAASSSGGGH